MKKINIEVKKIHLEEGEVICSKCNGGGYERDDSNFAKYDTCSRCLGEGKLDWIENIVGKVRETASFSVKSTWVSAKFPRLNHDYYVEMVEDIAKQFAEDIDREILESIIEQCSFDLNKKTKEVDNYDN